MGKLFSWDRILITMTALIAGGMAGSFFSRHIEAARKSGSTKEEMAEAIPPIAFYASCPKAWAAFRLAKEGVFPL